MDNNEKVRRAAAAIKAADALLITAGAALKRTKGTLIRVNPREDTVPAGNIGLPLGAADSFRTEHPTLFKRAFEGQF